MLKPITLCILLLMSLVVPAARGQGVARPDLSGSVKTAEGTPVKGATVMVWTAGVKTGYSTYCPSCYADCGKRAETSVDGGFTIPSLDPDLLFRILVVAEGYRPAFVTKVDPARGPLNAVLEPRPLPPPESRRVVLGRVVDAQGKPIAGAVVNPGMVRFSDGGGQGGAVEGLDPLAVTNSEGEFALCYKDPFASMDLETEARGMAKTQSDGLAAGPTVHTITLYEGASITGRVVKDGKPVPGILVGAAQPNRLGGYFLGHHTIGTDEQGRFRFDNIPIAKNYSGSGNFPPARLWAVYAVMDSVAGLGATTTPTVMVAEHGRTYSIDDLQLVPGLTLSGRVVLADSAPIPEGMRMLVSRMGAWDTRTIPLGPDGVFKITDLPADEYSISPAIKGYFLSHKNPSLSWGLEGRLDADLTGLTILMEPGEQSYEGLVSGRHRGKPLRGIDPADLPSASQAPPR